MAILGLLIILFLFASCDKDKNGGTEDPDQPLVYYSLTSEKDTITAGETTKVTSEATGYMLTYNWSATAGDILGSGNDILYAASPCHAGRNKITCAVSDGNNASQSKEIFIVVE